MSRFFDNSPSKKPKPTTARAGSGAAYSDGFQTVGEIFPDRVCPDEECLPPKHLLVRYKNGRPFVVCSKNIRDDPTSCQFTANKFGRDRGKGDSKIACIVCSVPVEHVLSIGRAVGKDPDSGKTTYDNVHVYVEDCIAKRGTDPVTKKQVLTHCCAATGSIVGTTCAAYNPDHTFDDLKHGCTGDISEGDTILRSWALKTPPEGLHARCAKRKHHALVAEILAEKKFRKASGTTAEDEAKAPSVEVPDDFDDF